MEDPIVEAMSAKTKDWFARAIVGMIWADGRIDQAEIKYLKSILGFLKDKELVHSVSEMIRQNRIPPLETLNLENTQALAVMKHLTSISIVDEELALAEETFLKAVASKLNLPAEVPEKFITLAKKRLGGNRFPACLILGEESLEISCFGFTENECLFFTDRLVNPLARLNFKLYARTGKQQQPGFYNPITAEAQWCRSVKSGVAKYVVKAALKKPISSDEGARLVFSLPEEEVINKSFEPDYNCLIGYYVKCRVCGEKDIPFWQLRSRSLHANTNLFGIPVYDKAYGDWEFCDYNLFQVSICPGCLFASNQIDYFQRQDRSIGVSLFDAKRFANDWQTALSKRKKLVGSNDNWLFSRERKPNQAIIAYELAIATHDLLGRLGDGTDFANHQRKSVSFILTQAEMLMNKGERTHAEHLLVKAKDRLEKAFPNFEREAGIRASQLIVLINIYFKEYDRIGDYLNYLNNFTRQNPPAPGTPEYKILQLAIRQTTEAWQSRDQYTCDSLKSFHLGQ
jgi:uncharacterized protein (DUF2225 family)